MNAGDARIYGFEAEAEALLGNGFTINSAFGFTDEHLRELARNSFEASFLPAEKKLEMLNLFDAVSSQR